MNRLQSLFGKKKNNLLSVYLTSGFPHLESTADIIRALDSRGVDMVEVGVPFSDPMADGPVIQQSSTTALANGITLRRILEQTRQARRDVPDMPFVLMGYLNPFIKYGFENLFRDAKAAGIDALIIPDLPFDDYLRDFKPLCDKYDLPMIMLVTPETSDERVRLIDSHCDGFIYMVSSASTTGAKNSFDASRKYFERMNALDLRHPRLIGFGISNAATLGDAWNYSSGAIVGSQFIKCLTEHPDDIPAAVDALLDKLSK